MRRRRALLWAGTLAGSGAAVFGTGAFDSGRANRTVTISVIDDSAALLSLFPGPGDAGNFVDDSGDVVRIDVGTVDNGTTTPAEGANPGSVTAIADILSIQNRGNDQVEVSEVDLGGGIALFVSYTDPSQVTTLADAPVTLDSGDTANVGLAMDAGHGTAAIPGTFSDGDAVQVTIVAATA